MYGDWLSLRGHHGPINRVGYQVNHRPPPPQKKTHTHTRGEYLSKTVFGEVADSEAPPDRRGEVTERYGSEKGLLLILIILQDT